MENSLFIPRYENAGMACNSKEESVMQDWTKKLYFKQQTSLISAIRGCDIPTATEDEKSVVKVIRGLVLRDADGRSKFMSHYPMDANKLLGTLVNASQYYNKWHWLNHVVSALYSISLYHHNEYTKLYYVNLLKAYTQVIDKEIDNVENKKEILYLCGKHFTMSKLEDNVVVSLLFTRTNYPHKVTSIAKILRGINHAEEDMNKIPELLKDFYNVDVKPEVIKNDVMRTLAFEDALIENPRVFAIPDKLAEMQREYALQQLPIEFNSDVSNKEKAHILHILGVSLIENAVDEEDGATVAE